MFKFKKGSDTITEVLRQKRSPGEKKEDTKFNFDTDTEVAQGLDL